MVYLSKHGGAQLLNDKPRSAQHIQRPVLSWGFLSSVAPVARSIPVRDSKAQEGLTHDNVDDIIGVLKDAFGAAHIQADSTSTDEPRTASTSHAAAAYVGSSVRRAGGARSLGKPTKSTAAGPVHGNSRRDAVQVPGAVGKKRRGPFVDLISALEQDMKHPATHSSRLDSGNSDSISSISSGNRSSSGKHISNVSSSNSAAAESASSRSPSSSSISSEGTNSSTVPSSRRSIRQIRGHTNSQPSPEQHQQQHHKLLQQPQHVPDWLHHPLVLAGSKKQFKPVFKGDLALPGGPAWSGLRRHVAAAGSNPELPTLQSIVLVEGDQDLRAVTRAVNAPVYVCDGTRVMKGHVRVELEMLKLLGRPLVVLTDPDERGRELRLHLDDVIGPVSHAFVPEQQSLSATDGPVHAAGNRGIEHVVPIGVQQALARSHDSYPRDRSVWSLQRLVDLGLANAYDAGETAAGRGAAARRRHLCAVLGLGKCTGAQLVTVLNRFFDEGTVEAALAGLRGDVQV